jgi:hypothetical protein
VRAEALCKLPSMQKLAAGGYASLKSYHLFVGFNPKSQVTGRLPPRGLELPWSCHDKSNNKIYILIKQ